MVITELDFQQGMPDDVVCLLADALDKPRFRGNLVKPPPFRPVARSCDMHSEPDTLGHWDDGESQEVERRAERVVASIAVEGGARTPPMKLSAEAKFIDKPQEMLVGAANEVVETLNGVTFKTKGAGEAAEVRCCLQNGNVVPSAGEIVARGETREPTTYHHNSLRRSACHRETKAPRAQLAPRPRVVGENLSPTVESTQGPPRAIGPGPVKRRGGLTQSATRGMVDMLTQVGVLGRLLRPFHALDPGGYRHHLSLRSITSAWSSTTSPGSS